MRLKYERSNGGQILRNKCLIQLIDRTIGIPLDRTRASKTYLQRNLCCLEKSDNDLFLSLFRSHVLHCFSLQYFMLHKYWFVCVCVCVFNIPF